VKASKINENLSIRQAVLLHDISPQSIINHLKNEKTPASDRHASYRKLTPIEEKVLAQHILRIYESGYPLLLLFFFKFESTWSL